MGDKLENGIKNVESRKPHLLIYAHYYPPDTASTGQLLKELAEGILDSFCITVVCVVPSYSGIVAKEYKAKKYYHESIGGVSIIRVWVPDFDKTDKRSRVRNIISYFYRAILATFRIRNVDYVYSISQPPVLGGILGVVGKWIKQAKFIYNIQDFNPEQIIATGYSSNLLILKMMMNTDKFLCRKADKVIVVGRDMVETLKNRFIGKKVPAYAFINNWIDEKEIYPLEQDEPNVTVFREQYGLVGKFVIMYSGNLGLYYDLENILKVIREFPFPIKTSDDREVVFVFVGDGSMRDKMCMYVQEHHIENVVFIPYQDKAVLNYSLNAANVHWCVNAKGIKGISTPSKFYGILATGKPIIGVMEEDTECRLIMEDTQCGLVCEPGDYEKIYENIQWFIEQAGTDLMTEMGIRGYKYLIKNLTKDMSVKRYIEEIMNY